MRGEEDNPVFQKQPGPRRLLQDIDKEAGSQSGLVDRPDPRHHLPLRAGSPLPREQGWRRAGGHRVCCGCDSAA